MFKRLLGVLLLIPLLPSLIIIVLLTPLVEVTLYIIKGNKVDNFCFFDWVLDKLIDFTDKLNIK